MISSQVKLGHLKAKSELNPKLYQVKISKSKPNLTNFGTGMGSIGLDHEHPYALVWNMNIFPGVIFHVIETKKV